ncbi:MULTISPECIES: radical SAM family heme chaperone HemW [Dictyoglomus]|jgi:oxygen-independent coproporphyrinogen-3 oxidase|uniref:Heme chaperone HemW n=1 Tax=Dictyoglomus turgidum (strain DSM 6724 / Z-1310) TaxID=515635 RepID=B8E2B1_DICTD|nr:MULTISPECIES: radical SAM family heme chaperone HemW [Dictyoglomus]ACK42388.1 oxygen-independent coproporphyrinogen III oxidase [Dictyoglomus turgidum DSM 6724]PNV79765.1 MAG: coproporphyrinogen III oxidase family protein [Dictyoglomus turgidum]HBU32156.1 coproporphyrinogen III oxidase family protein [Dictyoglomus sp.]
MISSNPIGIYIHIPFCVRKCPYCDFVSFRYSKEEEERYISHLLREIDMKSKGETIDTIYLGGGTPSILSLKGLEKIFEFIQEKFKLSKGVEISMEVNPGTVDREKIKVWKELGINRISIGAQSFIEKELKILGRIHDTDDIYKTFHMLREADFKNINIDLIYSLPFQEQEDFYFSLKEAVKLNPEHISIYNLMIEEGTLFYKMYLESKIKLPDSDMEAEMFSFAMNYLKDNGFIHYEISNFSKNENYKCKHNLKYWNQEKYYGFGVSAYSYDPPVRYGNCRNLYVYYGKIKKGILPIEEREFLTGDKLAKDFLFLRLRLMEGISKKEFENRFDKRIEYFMKNYSVFLENGLIKEEGDRVALTEKGILLANEIFQDIL